MRCAGSAGGWKVKDRRRVCRGLGSDAILDQDGRRSIAAGATASGDAQYRLQVPQIGGTGLGGGANLAFRNGVANTNVHGGPRFVGLNDI